jgi:hypothetical protein
MTPWIAPARPLPDKGGPCNGLSGSLVWEEFMVGPRLLLAAGTKPELDA